MSPSRWLAVAVSLALLAVGVAACGKQRKQLLREPLRPGRRRRLDRPGGRAGSLDRRIRERKLGRDDLLRPGRLGRRSRTVHRRRRRLRRQRRRALRRRRRADKAQKRCDTGRTDRDPGLHLADRDRLQPAEGVESLQLSTRNPGEDLQPGNHQLERPGDRQGQSRRRTARAPGSPRSTAPTSRARPRTSPTTSRRSSPSVWTYEVSGDWPVKGGEAAQGTSGVVEAVSAGEGAIGYADASQAGELGVATIKVGSEYVEPSAGSGGEDPRGVARRQANCRERPYMFPFELDRKTESKGTYPIVLVSYLMACTKYGSAERSGASSRPTSNTRSAPKGRKWPRKTPGSAPLSAALTEEDRSRPSKRSKPV